MDGDYLIPANSKKSMLILGFFNWIDLIIFGSGVVLSLILLMAVKSSNIWLMMLVLSPALISGFLVLPVPNYHNMLTLLSNIYRYMTMRKQYYWKGWCIKNGSGK